MPDLAAFGDNPLSPSTRKPAAMTGPTLGHSLADQVKAFWGG